MDPALPGWADFWCRPPGPGLQTPLSHVHSFLNLPQASRLLEMTILLQLKLRISPGNAEFYPQTELSSRPERTRISCHAALETTACAAFSKESLMKFANANINRKSGVA
jgi:hypothetical protein